MEEIAVGLSGFPILGFKVIRLTVHVAWIARCRPYKSKGCKLR